MAPLALRCIFLVKFPGVNGLTSYYRLAFAKTVNAHVTFLLKACEQREHMHLQQGRKKQAALSCIQEP